MSRVLLGVLTQHLVVAERRQRGGLPGYGTEQGLKLASQRPYLAPCEMRQDANGVVKLAGLCQAAQGALEEPDETPVGREVVERWSHRPLALQPPGRVAHVRQ